MTNLYEKNKVVRLDSKKELQEYPEREYIHTLLYGGEDILEKSDFPTSGALKVIKFTKKEDGDSYAFRSKLSPIKSPNSFPDSVEELYCYNGPFSKLPLSIHSIKYTNILKINENEIQDYEIPSHIKTITFFSCPNISGNNDTGNGFIKIPPTLKKLKFWCHFTNQDIPLRIGDFPHGLTTLIMGDCELEFKTKGIFPESLEKLELGRIDANFSGDDKLKFPGLFDFLPLNLQTFNVICSHVTPESNLKKFTTIKQLKVYLDAGETATGNEPYGIEPKSLPSSVTELTLVNYMDSLEKDIVPSTVTKLNLWIYSNKVDPIAVGALPVGLTFIKFCKFIFNPNVLPESITTIEFMGSRDMKPVNENEKFIKMLAILPKSLTSLTLPSDYKDFKNITFPSNIKQIEYK